MLLTRSSTNFRECTCMYKRSVQARGQEYVLLLGLIPAPSWGMLQQA
jgi:hypothetical protein